MGFGSYEIFHFPIETQAPRFPRHSDNSEYTEQDHCLGGYIICRNNNKYISLLLKYKISLPLCQTIYSTHHNGNITTSQAHGRQV